MSASPAFRPASFAEGLRLYELGASRQAIMELDEVLGDDPSNGEARHVLALCHRREGNLVLAEKELAEVLRKRPGDGAAWSNYGAVLRELGRLEEAHEALQSSLQLDGANPNAWNNLGTVLLDMDDRSGAERCFLSALEHRPNCAEARANLSRVCFEAGKLRDARTHARTAIALDPALPEAHNRLAIVQAATGDVEACVKSSILALDAAPDSDLHAGNLFLRALSSDQHTASDLKEMAEQWGAKFASVPLLNVQKPTQVCRIGLLSGDFRSHPVGHFLEPVLPLLGRRAAVYCYSTSTHEDEVTESLRLHCSGWRSVGRSPALEAAHTVFADDLDVLIDLSGHTRGGRLDILAHHPAKLQVSWLGFSGTTGLAQFDALIADRILVPDDHRDRYTERVLHLPDSFLCVKPSHVLEPSPGRMASFGVFNNPSKFSTSAYEAWARILLEAEGSTLLIKYHNLHDQWAQGQIRGRFERLGIPGDRIKFASTVPLADHLRQVASVGVALDTFPYTGATTTIDCLVAGVPIVTLAGDRYAARMTASLLNAAGRSETVATSVDDYVRLAVELYGDSRAGTHAANGLQNAFLSSPLCDPERFVAGLWGVLESLL